MFPILLASSCYAPNAPGFSTWIIFCMKIILYVAHRRVPFPFTKLLYFDVLFPLLLSKLDNILKFLDNDNIKFICHDIILKPN